MGRVSEMPSSVGLRLNTRVPPDHQLCIMFVFLFLCLKGSSLRELQMAGEDVASATSLELGRIRSIGEIRQTPQPPPSLNKKNNATHPQIASLSIPSLDFPTTRARVMMIMMM